MTLGRYSVARACCEGGPDPCGNGRDFIDSWSDNFADPNALDNYDVQTSPVGPTGTASIINERLRLDGTGLDGSLPLTQFVNVVRRFNWLTDYANGQFVEIEATIYDPPSSLFWNVVLGQGPSGEGGGAPAIYIAPQAANVLNVWGYGLDSFTLTTTRGYSPQSPQGIKLKADWVMQQIAGVWRYVDARVWYQNQVVFQQNPIFTSGVLERCLGAMGVEQIGHTQFPLPAGSYVEVDDLTFSKS